MTAKPTKEDLREAVNRTVPDLIGHDLDVLFCGINPGLYSGATGLHFAASRQQVLEGAAPERFYGPAAGPERRA